MQMDPVVLSELLEAFRQQLTSMSDDYSVDNVFQVDRRNADGSIKSSIYYGLCQPVPTANCGEDAGCCEVFQDMTTRKCATYTSSSSGLFYLDRFLQFESHGAAMIAGITLKYNNSDVRVASDSFGLKPPSGVDEMPLSFEIDIKCDPLVAFVQVPQIDARVQDGSIVLRTRIESQHGCVASTGKFLHLTSWKILFYMIAPLAIVAGLMLCLLGLRLFRITSLVLGLFFGLTIAGMVILFSVFLACEATKPPDVVDFWNWSHECTFHYLTANAYVGWIASISGLLFGLALAIAAYRKPSFGGVLIGMSVGAWVSDFLYVTTFSVLRQHWIVLVVSSLFIPLFALLGGFLPNSWKRAFFIIVISFTGGYLFCWGIGAYTQYFPSMTLLEELGPRWQYIVFAIAIASLGVIGSIVQFTVTGAFDWDTLMDSGLCPGRATKRRGGKATTESLLSGDAASDIEMSTKTNSIIDEINDVEQ